MASAGGMDKNGKRNRLGSRRQRHLYKSAKGKTLATDEYAMLCAKADSLNGMRR